MQKPKVADSKKENYIRDKGGCDSAVLKQKYAVRITDSVKNTIHGDVHNDPVAKQYIPQARELKILPQENIDPIGDAPHSPIKGIIHRYPDRVLFKPADVCAVYCRYCFRREAVGPGANILNAKERAAAINYIRDHEAIREVILSGGDPLILAPRQLADIFEQLDGIEHVHSIRIHTRVPIADPKRVTKAMIETLASSKKPLYIVLHINHAQEISDIVKDTIKSIHATGCTLLSQSVLLKGVNDNADTLENLFRALVAINVKPYQLHHPDMAPGTSHFRLSIKRGQAIMSELQGRLSGIALPNYMLDIPGGYGKIPLTTNYLQQLENGQYIVEDPHGQTHHYPPEGERYE